MPPEHTHGIGELDQATSVFLNVRQRLFGIAYRMLGSAAEAEDIVQETWIRWQAKDRATVLDPPAFLATITIRLALNLAQSARSRRETYIGPWLPEPIDTSSDPYLGAERGEALSLALLLLLEKLSPHERAAYVLREAFDYPYSTIAELLETTEANVRQIVSRARRHIAAQGHASVQPPTFEQQSNLLHAFIRAAQQGQLAELERLFASEVVSSTDGNGIVNAARIPVVGRARVAKFVVSFPKHFWAGATVAYILANGQPAILLSRNGSVFAFATLEVSGDSISQILWVMSPAKLASISRSWPEAPQNIASSPAGI
ncbi:RNA polymerase sigma-70 factor [Edaphobacter modestus]|uniref:RNA polymerase sigma-70 factor (ECF subfamily) n=1 Tax=Edaphobacter modestus TaxID=388466 RepID=A0A4V2G4P7_9BACT|nr:RNA polymerase sigma-70 factor [Edaphobacter modestus]RZU41806.1 RNA polymerase sigma-70 factor (ECF subfamily) [Edaphobacter modestus]